MKKILLFVLAIGVFLSYPLLGYAQIYDGLVWNAVPIKERRPDYSDGGIARSPIFTLAQAFVSEKVLLVEILCLVDDVSIMVTDVKTGRIVYSETFMETDKVLINLEAADVGVYQVDIIADDVSMYGEFSF